MAHRGTYDSNVFKPVPDTGHDAFHVSTLLQKAQSCGEGDLADYVELVTKGQRQRGRSGKRDQYITYRKKLQPRIEVACISVGDKPAVKLLAKHVDGTVDEGLK